MKDFTNMMIGTFIGIGSCIFVLGWSTPSKLVAQEKPVREMRQWQLGWLPELNSGRMRVDVFDTEGVCLYIVEGFTKDVIDKYGKAGSVSVTLTAAITAVPKTQLPKGTGCQ